MPLLLPPPFTTLRLPRRCLWFPRATSPCCLPPPPTGGPLPVYPTRALPCLPPCHLPHLHLLPHCDTPTRRSPIPGQEGRHRPALDTCGPSVTLPEPHTHFAGGTCLGYCPWFGPQCCFLRPLPGPTFPAYTTTSCCMVEPPPPPLPPVVSLAMDEPVFMQPLDHTLPHMPCLPHASPPAPTCTLRTISGSWTTHLTQPYSHPATHLGFTSPSPYTFALFKHLFAPHMPGLLPPCLSPYTHPPSHHTGHSMGLQTGQTFKPSHMVEGGRKNGDTGAVTCLLQELLPQIYHEP